MGCFVIIRWSLFALVFMLGASFSASAADFETLMQGAVSVLPQRDKALSINLGAGLADRPKYLGAKEYEATALPLIDIEYDARLFASTQRGLGLFLLTGPSLRIGPRLTYDEGRDAQNSARTASLDDVKASVEAGIYFESYVSLFRFKGDIRKGLGGGHKGKLARLDAAIAIAAGSANDTLFIGGNLSWADTTYTQAYFGVPASRATAPVPAFSPKSGPRDLNVYASFVHTFADGAYVTLDGGAGALLGDADKSPVKGNLDQSLTQFYIGAMAGYRF